MEVPLGQIDELVVSPEYVRYLVRIANSKMEANKRRMNGFLDLLQTKVLSYFVLLCSLYCRSLFLLAFIAKMFGNFGYCLSPKMFLLNVH